MHKIIISIITITAGLLFAAAGFAEKKPIGFSSTWINKAFIVVNGRMAQKQRLFWWDIKPKLNLGDKVDLLYCPYDDPILYQCNSDDELVALKSFVISKHPNGNEPLFHGQNVHLDENGKVQLSSAGAIFT